MIDTQEKKEKYVTEEMLEKTLIRFGDTLQENITKNIRENIIKHIGGMFDEFEERFGLLMLKHFNRVDKRIDGLEERFEAVDKRFDSIDMRFDKMDQRFDGIDMRLDRIGAHFDNHLLDCVTRGEHKKLEKRVGLFEVLKRKPAMN